MGNLSLFKKQTDQTSDEKLSKRKPEKDECDAPMFFDNRPEPEEKDDDTIRSSIFFVSSKGYFFH